jgi:hypothetical protein
VGRVLGSRSDGNGVADVDDSRADDPAVQGDPAAECSPDVAKDVEILIPAVWVDRGDKQQHLDHVRDLPLGGLSQAVLRTRSSTDIGGADGGVRPDRAEVGSG